MGLLSPLRLELILLQTRSASAFLGFSSRDSNANDLVATQDATDLGTAAEESVLHTVGRDASDFGNFFDGVLEAVTQDQHGTLAFGESVEAFVSEQRVFGRAVADALFFLEGGPVRAAFTGDGAERGARGDAIGPTLERAFSPEVSRRLQYLDHAELNCVVGVRTVPKHRAANPLDAAQ